MCIFLVTLIPVSISETSRQPPAGGAYAPEGGADNKSFEEERGWSIHKEEVSTNNNIKS